jgi:VWFA-related protein
VSTVDVPTLDKAVQSTAVTIYPIAYPAVASGDGPDPKRGLKELSRLAEVTGGRLFILSSEQALAGVLDEIVADLRAQYVLGFAPSAAGDPGRLRKISVKVPGHGKVVVRHRVGYRSPS